MGDAVTGTEKKQEEIRSHGRGREKLGSVTKSGAQSEMQGTPSGGIGKEKAEPRERNALSGWEGFPCVGKGKHLRCGTGERKHEKRAGRGGSCAHLK